MQKHVAGELPDAELVHHRRRNQSQKWDQCGYECRKNEHRDIRANQPFKDRRERPRTKGKGRRVRRSGPAHVQRRDRSKKKAPRVLRGGPKGGWMRRLLRFLPFSKG